MVKLVNSNKNHPFDHPRTACPWPGGDITRGDGTGGESVGDLGISRHSLKGKTCKFKENHFLYSFLSCNFNLHIWHSLAWFGMIWLVNPWFSCVFSFEPVTSPWPRFGVAPSTTRASICRTTHPVPNPKTTWQDRQVTKKMKAMEHDGTVNQPGVMKRKQRGLNHQRGGRSLFSLFGPPPNASRKFCFNGSNMVICARFQQPLTKAKLAKGPT